MPLTRVSCIAGLVLASAVSMQVRAGPDETTNYLMSERVSLLDWGVLRMEWYLRDLSVRGHRLPTSVEYKYDENQILINGFVLGPIAAKDAVAICRDGVSLIRAT